MKRPRRSSLNKTSGDSLSNNLDSSKSQVNHSKTRIHGFFVRKTQRKQQP